jgi:hypothetical protein
VGIALRGRDAWAAEQAAIVKRADLQHARALAGDDRGVYRD